MKKFNLILSLITCLALSAVAQPTVTLMTFESYTFSDKFDTQYGKGKVQDGFQFGGGLEIGLNETKAFEIIYQHLKTDVYYQGFDQRYDGNVNISYIMLGGTNYLNASDVISVFGTFNAGAGIFTPNSTLKSGTISRLTLGGRLGIRIMPSDKVSLRLHMQLFSPVQWAGGGFYFGSGGSGAGVSTGSTIYQFNLGGSLNYRLK